MACLCGQVLEPHHRFCFACGKKRVFSKSTGVILITPCYCCKKAITKPCTVCGAQPQSMSREQLKLELERMNKLLQSDSDMERQDHWLLLARERALFRLDCNLQDIPCRCRAFVTCRYHSRQTESKDEPEAQITEQELTSQ